MKFQTLLLALSLAAPAACKSESPKPKAAPASVQAAAPESPQQGQTNAKSEAMALNAGLVPTGATLTCVRLTDDLIDCHLMDASKPVILPSNSSIDWNLTQASTQSHLVYETADRGNSEKSWVITLPKGSDGELHLLVKSDKREFGISLSVADINLEPPM